jgi:hypothetical protein
MMIQTKLSFYFLAALYILIIYQATTQEQDCQELCDNVLLPDLLIPFTDSVTSKTFHQSLGFTPAEDCSTTVTEIPLDLPSWCGCESAEASDIYKELYKGGDVELIDAELEIPNTNGLTCGYVAELAPYVSDEEICGQFLLAHPLCCVDPNFLLCPNGSPITLPNCKLGSSKEDIACWTSIDQILLTLNEVQTKTLLAETSLDLP